MPHVLVIEDDLLIAQLTADMAAYAGASSVEIAHTEVAAVKAAMLRRPCIIVSDVDLRLGGRGPQAVAQIQEHFGAIPAIFITGDPHDEQARSLATAVLTKPTTLQFFEHAFGRATAALRTDI